MVRVALYTLFRYSYTQKPLFFSSLLFISLTFSCLFFNLFSCLLFSLLLFLFSSLLGRVGKCLTGGGGRGVGGGFAPQGDFFGLRHSRLCRIPTCRKNFLTSLENQSCRPSPVVREKRWSNFANEAGKVVFLVPKNLGHRGEMLQMFGNINEGLETEKT